jgi:hypothetical protein
MSGSQTSSDPTRGRGGIPEPGCGKLGLHFR